MCIILSALDFPGRRGQEGRETQSRGGTNCEAPRIRTEEGKCLLSMLHHPNFLFRYSRSLKKNGNVPSGKIRANLWYASNIMGYLLVLCCQSIYNNLIAVGIGGD
jgi:hypothetical protein